MSEMILRFSIRVGGGCQNHNLEFIVMQSNPVMPVHLLPKMSHASCVYSSAGLIL